MFTKKPSKFSLPYIDRNGIEYHLFSLGEHCGCVFPDSVRILKNGVGQSNYTGQISQKENIFGEGRTNSSVILFNRKGCGFDN